MAVFASPAGKFRWCKLYTNQKKPVFMDSHVKFFEYMRGGYSEVVYDNMRNVVTKFIGKNEKELNADLIKMSMYYGFAINVTNCFSGSEKGTVEKSVDVLRTELFAINYSFNTLDDAQTYVNAQLLKLNEGSLVLEEKERLTPHKPPLELAEIQSAKVDKTSLISVDTVKYSVPEEYVGKTVTVKKYHDEIRVFVDNTEVCRHRRAFGNGTVKIDIMHYLTIETIARELRLSHIGKHWRESASDDSLTHEQYLYTNTLWDSRQWRKNFNIIFTLDGYPRLLHHMDIFRRKNSLFPLQKVAGF